jgi:archaellum component FlaC
LRDDIATLLESAIGLVGGLSINQFTCNWRGNYLLEPGDKIGIITKDDSTIFSYVLNDKYTYNGGINADTLWEYADNEDETASNPSSIGDAIKKTFARVDKVNREIELVASEVYGFSSSISQLKLDTQSISATVQEVSQTTNETLQNLNHSTSEGFETVNENIATLTQEVNTKMTANDVSISIQTALEQGVESVITTTGFTFNEEGLHINKTGSEITTTITEDGMTVYREYNEVLVADNLGVRAEDLHATTYLFIGVNSRIEDYDNNARTGCFWVGL